MCKLNDIRIHLYRYWGKAKKTDKHSSERAQNNSISYHLLVYHCLDVASVAFAWWRKSSTIRNRFLSHTGLPEDKVLAWLLFFVALHDLGKIDVRFQLKAPEVAKSLWTGFSNATFLESKSYFHGPEGYNWFFHNMGERLGRKSPSDFLFNDDIDSGEFVFWEPWVQAVTGHHGIIPLTVSPQKNPTASPQVIKHDQEARLEFIELLEAIFLQKAGLCLQDKPPDCPKSFMAGFCSICDWLGSTEADMNQYPCFTFISECPDNESLQEYIQTRLSIAEYLVDASGLSKPALLKGGMSVILPKGYTPQQVQTLIDKIPVHNGFTLIEASTGSGKTEAALAHASRLLAEKKVESIIFALPTQATANAMLGRLLEVSPKLFPEQADVVLAHGKSRFQQDFINLKDAAKIRTPQDRENELEATAQCSQWLSQSRKRAFLGQIGVCTIDQVLISVLPVKHKFVRSFGLGKSVLIVDEVHAYDSYMYGLLEVALKGQRENGGSTILLSATLPHHQRQRLIRAWSGQLTDISSEADFPMITYISYDNIPACLCLSKSEKEKIKERHVSVSCLETQDVLPDKQLIEEIVKAAEKGGRVAMICNMVADAQKVARLLRESTSIPVDLFHSRFRFIDRQAKEAFVMAEYGKDSKRNQGRILVATQVVEQSLDLDFDWMITQLCPIDLLFQRLGRLHRHDRSRPQGLESPACTVLLPMNNDYGLHQLIYGNKDAPNSRVLWRTEQVLRKTDTFVFPAAYRTHIERVYEINPWESEPEKIQEEYDRYWITERAKWDEARHLSSENVKAFMDTDVNVSTLTRDGEMSLNVVPVEEILGERRLLDDGLPLNQVEEYKRDELINLNTIPVPASWRKFFGESEDGIFYLPMTRSGEQWVAELPRARFFYNKKNGLEIEKL